MLTKEESRYITKRAVSKGEIIQKPCEKCGDDKSEAHHDDYAKPLEIRWLCKKHHAEHHRVTAKSTFPTKYHSIRLYDLILFKQAKIRAAQDEVSLLELVQRALREYLKKA